MKKYYFLILILCLMFLLVSAVSANPYDDSNINSTYEDYNNKINENKFINKDYDTSSNGYVNDSSSNWYVNGSRNEDGNGTMENPFNNIESSITHSNDGDTIYIASGPYKGIKNLNLTINKRLNFINYGDGEVIFDGEDNYQIFNVTVNSLNITGLTFTNAYSITNGGCINFETGLINSKINANFINCSAFYGGAIYFNGDVINNIFIGSFINNTALGHGGAIYLNSKIKNK